MEKIALKCDVCGGTLTMQPGGQGAVCEYCGMNYAIGRLQEKVQEIRGRITVEGVVKTEHSDFDIQGGILMKYHGRSVDVVVPDDVRAIGEHCFSEMSQLNSITLPAGLKEIKTSAFAGCSGLSRVTIPAGVSKIGDRAFFNCTGLMEVSLFEGLTEIGSAAFFNCTGLTRIDLPETVAKINDDAFEGCANLKTVTLPSKMPVFGTYSNHYFKVVLAGAAAWKRSCRRRRTATSRNSSPVRPVPRGNAA